jgi:PAS domain S-box-containing protein
MLNFLRDLRLHVKVSLLGAVSVLITAVALVLLTVWQSGQYHTLAQREVDKLINADLDHITQGVYNLVRSENDAIQQQIDYNLKGARLILSEAGGISLSEETESWTTVNQFTGKPTKAQLPRMLVGGKWLGRITDPAAKTIVVDKMTRLVGETATIFQRMNDKGDMLRVATTVKTAEGKRAIGTYIPAVNPDGTPNPVIATIMQGKTYHGRAYVVNAWYLTAYEPIRDRTGRVAGMLYVGIKQESVESLLRQAILQTKVGKTGYVFVLGGKGTQRGRYVISQQGKRDGENIWETRDLEGRPVIQEIINKATTLKRGELGTVRYLWQNIGEPGPRWKIARLAYFEPWDWVIGTSVSEEELQTYQKVLSGGRAKMTSYMGIAGLAIIFLIGLLGALVARTIARPVNQMKEAVETIIDGNLDQTVDVHSRDEIGSLAQAFNVMTGRLNKTMEELRESEEKYRGIFEQAVEGLFQTTFQGSFLSVNPAMARITGYDSPQELISCVNDLRQQLYVNPEDRDAIVASIMEQGEVLGREVQFSRKDQRKIWVSISARLVQDEAGRPQCIEGYLVDITEQRRAEEALQKSKALLADAERVAGWGSWEWDIANDTIYVSDGLKRLAGLPLDYPPVPLGDFIDDTVHPGDQKTRRQNLDEVVRGLKPQYDYEFRIIRQDTGQVRIWHGAGEVQVDASGYPVRIIATDRDVTDQRLAEEALRESEARYRALVENQVEAVCRWLPDTTLTYVNEAYCRLLGKPRDELLGNSFLDFIPVENRSELIRHVHSLLHHPRLAYYEHEVVSEEQGTVWMRWSDCPIFDGKGNVLEFQLVGIDITDRKIAELALISQREQLRKLATELAMTEERERQNIATELHDTVGQQLAAAKMKMDALAGNPEYRNEDGNLVKAYNLILQAISCIRSLTFDISPPTLYMVGFEAAVHSLCEKFEEETGILVDFVEKGETKLIGKNLRGTLYRMVGELLHNILKHAQAEHATVSLNCVTNFIEICVEDNGTGFDAREVLIQGNKNNCVGLFSIKQRIEYLGGSMTIDSRPGAGSRITLRVPLHVELPQDQGAA